MGTVFVRINWTKLRHHTGKAFSNFLSSSIEDPDTGSGIFSAFLAPGSGMEKNSAPNPDHISES